MECSMGRAEESAFVELERIIEEYTIVEGA